MAIKHCPYPLTSGVRTVEIINGYCEIGCNCFDKCQYNFSQDEEKKVNKIFETYTPLIQ